MTGPDATIRPVSRTSSLRPEAQEFIPGGIVRPQLTLCTGLQEHPTTRHAEAVSPTPEIRVLGPPAEVGSTLHSHTYRAYLSHERARRRSSPVRRRSRSVVSMHTHPYYSSPTDASNQRLLSPVRAWVQDSYHPGDRNPSTSYADHPPALPDQTSFDGSAPSPSDSRTSARGAYYCTFEGCKRRGKAWNTESELRKHQRVHLPKHLRPHPCPYCEQRFNYPKDVARHVSSKHQVGPPSTCQKCGQVLSRGDNLQRHMWKQHNICMTPNTMESAAPSPASTTLDSNISECMYSDTSPSTVETSWSPAQQACKVLQGRLLLPSTSYFPPTPSPRRPRLTSEPMVKSYSH